MREEFLIAVGLRLENGSEGQNTKPESEPEKEYTLEEAAAELGISRRTLGRKIDAGEIQTEKREYQQILIKEKSIEELRTMRSGKRKRRQGLKRLRRLNSQRRL